MPGRSIPGESANPEGPTYSQIPSSTPPRRLLRTRRSEPTLPSRRLVHSSAALEQPMLPPTSFSFHQPPSHLSRNRSSSADSRLRAWRRKIEPSSMPGTESLQDQNPSPTATVGPWESISRVGTPPPDHPNRDSARVLYIVSMWPCVNFKCFPPQTDKEHHAQLDNAEKHRRRIRNTAAHYKDLLEKTDEDLKEAFNAFSQYMALYAQINVYIACLKRSRDRNDDVWEQLRQISAEYRPYIKARDVMDWSRPADEEERVTS